MKTALTLKYAGGRAAEGEMDAYAVGKGIIGFNDYVSMLLWSLGAEAANLRSAVRGVRQGSLDIDFLLTITGGLANVFGVASLRDIITLLSDTLELFKHLGGKPPVSREFDGDMVRIENTQGNVTYVKAHVVNVTLNDTFGRAAENWIRRPLKNEAESVSLTSDDQNVIEPIFRNQADMFVPLAFEEQLLEQKNVVGLTIETASFKEGNKWRFKDNDESFWAAIEDEGFRRRVEQGQERFGKGDQLLVQMTSRLVRNQTGQKVERVITSVMRHETAVQQPSLPLSGDAPRD